MIWTIAIWLSLVPLCTYVLGLYMGSRKTTLWTWERARTMTPDAFAQFKRVVTTDADEDQIS